MDPKYLTISCPWCGREVTACPESWPAAVTCSCGRKSYWNKPQALHETRRLQQPPGKPQETWWKELKWLWALLIPVLIAIGWRLPAMWRALETHEKLEESKKKLDDQRQWFRNLEEANKKP